MESGSEHTPPDQRQAAQRALRWFIWAVVALIAFNLVLFAALFLKKAGSPGSSAVHQEENGGKR